MKIKSTIKAGVDGLSVNHNQTISRGLQVKSSLKAGALDPNHNQTIKKG